tara:strand:- start:82 stop:558 length:477 start_codon:yes stop_codon:yes gene_type:complete
MAIKANEKFEMKDLDDFESFEDALDKIEEKLKPNTKYTLYLLDSEKNRTLSANRYYFGVVLKTIAEHMGESNLDIVIEDLHEVLKGRFNSKTVIIDGEAYEIGETTKKMSQNRFVEYIEEIREWSLDSLKCYIPLPQEVVKAEFGDLYIQSYHDFKSK